MARTRLGGAIALVALAWIAVTACNPLVRQTHDPAADQTYPAKVDYAGTAPGWLEVRVTAGTGAISVSASVYDRSAAAGSSDCSYGTESRPAWDGGASQGYQRLTRIGPGSSFFVQVDGPTTPTTFDVRVVDDAGAPTGDLTHHVTIHEPFDEVGWPIC